MKIDVNAKLRRIMACKSPDEKHQYIKDLVEELDTALSCPFHKESTASCQICAELSQIRARFRENLGG